MPLNNLTVEELQAFYHTANIENLASILQNGILSRNEVMQKKLYKPKHDISNAEIQKIRSMKTFSSPRTGKMRRLHDFANTYLQPNNAFLVAIQNKISRNQICVIRIKSSIIKDRQNEAVLTIKNAACKEAVFCAPNSWAPSPTTTRALTAPRLSGLYSTMWVGEARFNQIKQSRQSEALFPKKIDSAYFDCIFVYNETAKLAVEKIIRKSGLDIPVLFHPTLFTSPGCGAFNKQMNEHADPKNPARLFSQLKFNMNAELDAEEAQSEDNQQMKRSRSC